MKSLVRLGVIFICMVLLVSYGFTEAEDSKYWPVEVDEKCGYEDKVFNIVIKPQFDNCDFFYEGLARVKIKDKWGFINETGKIVISAKFDEVMFRFYEGLASVEVGGKWGYIDKTGKYVIEPKFDYADDSFTDGLARVRIGDKWGYIDKTGKYIIELKFAFASPFWEELASVKVGNKWGFINKKGDIVIDPRFDFDSPLRLSPFFRLGKSWVKIDNKWKNIDMSGEIISKDWEYCYQNKVGVQFVYYNKKSMSYPSKNIVRVWAKWVKLGEGYNMDLHEIDCLNKTTKLLNSTRYNKEGKVISSYSLSAEKSELNYIVPNSLMEGLSDSACSPKSK